MNGFRPLSRAKKAAAFFRISRSSRKMRFSRRRRLSSSRSSLVALYETYPAQEYVEVGSALKQNDRIFVQVSAVIRGLDDQWRIVITNETSGKHILNMTVRFLLIHPFACWIFERQPSDLLAHWGTVKFSGCKWQTLNGRWLDMSSNKTLWKFEMKFWHDGVKYSQNPSDISGGDTFTVTRNTD